MTFTSPLIRFRYDSSRKYVASYVNMLCYIEISVLEKFPTAEMTVLNVIQKLSVGLTVLFN